MLITDNTVYMYSEKADSMSNIDLLLFSSSPLKLRCVCHSTRNFRTYLLSPAERGWRLFRFRKTGCGRLRVFFNERHIVMANKALTRQAPQPAIRRSFVLTSRAGRHTPIWRLIH